MATIDPSYFYIALVVIGVLFFSIMAYVLHSNSNSIAWWQLIAVKGRDGKSYADITKVGLLVGIVVAAWTVIALSARVASMTAVEFSLIFSLALVYFAGVTTFQAYMKSKGSSQPEGKQVEPQQ